MVVKARLAPQFMQECLGGWVGGWLTGGWPGGRVGG
jgi:hypothetical protein